MLKYSSRCNAVLIVSTSYYSLYALVTVDIYFHTLCTGSRLILIYSLEQAEARWGYKSDRNNILEQIVMQQRQYLAERMRPAVNLQHTAAYYHVFPYSVKVYID